MSQQKKIDQLHGMFADMTMSVVGTVLDAHNGDIDPAIDTLLQMTADETGRVDTSHDAVADSQTDFPAQPGQAHDAFIKNQLEAERYYKEQLEKQKSKKAEVQRMRAALGIREDAEVPRDSKREHSDVAENKSARKGAVSPPKHKVKVTKTRPVAAPAVAPAVAPAAVPVPAVESAEDVSARKFIEIAARVQRQPVSSAAGAVPATAPESAAAVDPDVLYKERMQKRAEIRNEAEKAARREVDKRQTNMRLDSDAVENDAQSIENETDVPAVVEDIQKSAGDGDLVNKKQEKTYAAVVAAAIAEQPMDEIAESLKKRREERSEKKSRRKESRNSATQLQPELPEQQEKQEQPEQPEQPEQQEKQEEEADGEEEAKKQHAQYEEVEVKKRAVYEEENRRLTEEADRLRALLKQQANETTPVPPTVAIYTRFKGADDKHDAATAASNAEFDAKMNNDVAQLRDILVRSKVAPDSIDTVDVANDFETANFLIETMGKAGGTYPFVCIRGHPIGDLAALKTVVEKGHLSDYLSGAVPADDAMRDGTGQFVGQGVLDRCLDATEYIASTVSSLLMLPITIISWPFRSSAAKQVPKGDNDVDIDMVHTNWYWRNQKRKFRFYDTYFVRMHPVHMDIRAFHPYNSIASLSMPDASHIVIRYKTDCSPDHITGLEADCARIRDLIVARATEDIFVNYGDNAAPTAASSDAASPCSQ